MPNNRFSIVTRGGVALSGEHAGPAGGPKVILLHGGGQTRHSWKSALRTFGAAGYRAIAYDARGHGDSEWAPDADYSFHALAHDLVDIAGDARAPVALIGASMGGITGIMAAGESLLGVAALVLVDIVPTPSTAGGTRIARFMTAHTRGFATLDEAADAVSAYYPDRPRPNDVSGLKRNLRLHEDGRLYWHWDPRLFGDGRTAEPPDVASWAKDLAPRITAPTLLLRGERSDVVDDASVAETRKLMPKIEVVSIGGAGHMLVGDRNDVFNAHALSFVARHLPVARDERPDPNVAMAK